MYRWTAKKPERSEALQRVRSPRNYEERLSLLFKLGDLGDLGGVKTLFHRFLTESEGHRQVCAGLQSDVQHSRFPLAGL